MATNKPNLNKTTPPDEASRKFFRQEELVDALKGFVDPSIDKATKATKIFNRKKNRFGNDEATAIRQYESVEEADNVVDENLYDERRHNAHRKLKKRHVFVNGEWKGIASQARNNKEAKRDSKGFRGKVEIVKEEFPPKNNNNIGLNKPIGTNTKRNNDGTKFHDDLKTWANNKKKIKNKSEMTAASDNAAPVDESVVNEISTSLLSRYAKKASGDAANKAYYAGQDGKRKGAKGLSKAQKRVKNVKKAIDKIGDRCCEEVIETKVELVKSIILDDYKSKADFMRKCASRAQSSAKKQANLDYANMYDEEDKKKKEKEKQTKEVVK